MISTKRANNEDGKFCKELAFIPVLFDLCPCLKHCLNINKHCVKPIMGKSCIAVWAKYTCLSTQMLKRRHWSFKGSYNTLSLDPMTEYFLIAVAKVRIRCYILIETYHRIFTNNEQLNFRHTCDSIWISFQSTWDHPRFVIGFVLPSL